MFGPRPGSTSRGRGGAVSSSSSRLPTASAYQARESDADRAKLSALAKQLSQLDAAGSKIGETCRFIADLQGSKDTKVDLERAPQQRKQLHELRKKLQATVSELQRLESLADGGAIAPLEDGSDLTPRDSATATDQPSLAAQPALTGGTVSTTVAKITNAAAAESATAMNKLKEEMRRLQATQKEVAELEVAVAELRPKVAAGGDLKSLRDQVATLHAQADEIATLQAAAVQMSVGLEKLPALREEVAQLRPAAAEAAALEEEAKKLRGMDVERHKLRQEISNLQPKVVLVERMQYKLSQMQATVSSAVPLETQVAELQSEVDKLPELRQRMYSLKAGAAEVRQLERILQDYSRQEDFKARLQEKEAELVERVAGIEELKRQVDLLQASAVEADLLESRFASLASVANRLPNLRAQNDALMASADEVSRLEKEHNKLKEAAAQKQYLAQQIETLVPQLADLEALKREVENLQQQVLESEEFVSRSEGSTANGAVGEGSLSARGAEVGNAGFLNTPYLSAGSLNTPRLSLDMNASLAKMQQGKTLPTRGVMAAAYAAAAGSAVAPQLPSPTSSTGAAHSAAQAETALRDNSGQGAGASVVLAFNIVEPPVVVPLNVCDVCEVKFTIGELPPLYHEIRDAVEEVRRLEAAKAELHGLETHRALLEQEVEELRASPAAAEVLKLQARLLDLQQLEVESLQQQVNSLEATGERLVQLRSELASLEADADEVYMLEMRIPDLEKALERAPEVKSRHAELEAQLSSMNESEEAIGRLSQVGDRKRTLEIQKAQMNANAAEVDRLTRELAGAQDVAMRLAMLKAQHEMLLAQHKEIESLSDETELMAAHLAEVDGLRERHARLEDEHRELLKLAAETSVLNRDNEVLRMQLNVAVAMFASTAMDGGETIARVARISGDQPDTLSNHAGDGALVAKNDSAKAMDAAVSSIVTPSKDGASVDISPLDAVFNRIRIIEAEKLALGAENEELRSEVDRLQDALEASADVVNRLKGLSQTMMLIRGSSKPSSKMVTEEPSAVSSSGNLRMLGEERMEYSYPAHDTMLEEGDYSDSPPATDHQDFTPELALGIASSPAH